MQMQTQMQCEFDVYFKNYLPFPRALHTSLHFQASPTFSTHVYALASLATPITMINAHSLAPLHRLLAILCILFALSSNLTTALPVPSDSKVASIAVNVKPRTESTTGGEDVVWEPSSTPVTGISFMQGAVNEDGTEGPEGIVVS